MTAGNAASRLLPVIAAVLLLPWAPRSEAEGSDFAGSRNLSALNVSIAVFDPGVPADRALHRDLQIFPRIREVEAKFLPFVLRDRLAMSGDWGAVRVVTAPDPAAEVQVSGTILQSDGETLEIHIVAIDASGRGWIDKTYSSHVDDAPPQDGGVQGDSPHGRLYDEVAGDLRAARGQLDERALRRVADTSLLRYAVELAPSAFGDYLAEDGQGRYSLRRLPARDDPMLQRIERIRLTEYVITDTVDAKFRELHAEIASTYALWRQYRRKSLEYEQQNARHAADNESEAPRGSYEAIRNLYDNYKWDRVTAQERDRLAIAFSNEVGPVVDAMEARIAELEDWVDAKYAEWHRLLEELFDAESAVNQVAR